jgi:hypothetical protein
MKTIFGPLVLMCFFAVVPTRGEEPKKEAPQIALRLEAIDGHTSFEIQIVGDSHPGEFLTFGDFIHGTHLQSEKFTAKQELILRNSVTGERTTLPFGDYVKATP